MTTAVWTGAVGDGQWFTSGNWQGDSVPASGEAVQLPATTDGLNTTIVLSQNAEVGDLSIGGSYSIQGSSIRVDGTLSADGTDTLSSDLIGAGQIDVGTGEFDTGATLTIAGSFSGFGGVYLNPIPSTDPDAEPNGTLKIEGPTSNLGQIYFSDGTLDAESALAGNVFIADSDLGDGVLEGNGSVQGIVVANTGSVSLFRGNQADTVTCNGSVALATLKELITGSETAGQLVITGTNPSIGVDSFYVSLAAGVPIPYGHTFTVIKDETSTALGQILGAPDGAVFTTSQGVTYRINYLSSTTGSDATLTVLLPPISIISPAHASPNVVAGDSTVLTALGSTSPAAALTYHWAVVAAPPEAPKPRFSTNGSAAAHRSVVNFGKAGYYRLRCTISDGTGESAASDVSVRVEQVTTSLRLRPLHATVAKGRSIAITSTELDQFGDPLADQGNSAFSILSGPGTVNATTGQYTATAFGTVLIEAEEDKLTGDLGLEAIGS